MPLGALLALLAVPLVKKVLVALGFGIVTYTGFVTVKGQFDTMITAALGDIGQDVYQILALAGFVDAIGIWMGGLSSVIGLMTLKRLRLL